MAKKIPVIKLSPGFLPLEGNKRRADFSTTWHVSPSYSTSQIRKDFLSFLKTLFLTAIACSALSIPALIYLEHFPGYPSFNSWFFIKGGIFRAVFGYASSHFTLALILGSLGLAMGFATLVITKGASEDSTRNCWLISLNSLLLGHNTVLLLAIISLYVVVLLAWALLVSSIFAFFIFISKGLEGR